MIVRVLFPPDGTKYVDFKDADGYSYNDHCVKVFKNFYNYYGDKTEEALGFFTKENIVGVIGLDEIDEKEKQDG